MKPTPPPPNSDIALPPFNPGAVEGGERIRPVPQIPDPEADDLIEPEGATRDELPDIDFGAPLRP